MRTLLRADLRQRRTTKNVAMNTTSPGTLNNQRDSILLACNPPLRIFADLRRVQSHTLVTHAHSDGSSLARARSIDRSIVVASPRARHGAHDEGFSRPVLRFCELPRNHAWRNSISQVNQKNPTNLERGAI